MYERLCGDREFKAVRKSSDELARVSVGRICEDLRDFS